MKSLTFSKSLLLTSFLFATALMSSIEASAATDPILIPYSDHNLRSERISIDGKLSEAVWQQQEVHTGFYNHFPLDQGLSENQTEVRIFHDSVNLYIGAIYHDTEARNNISSLKRDNYDDGVFLSDCFGVILDPYNNGDNGYLFAVNARGVQFDALIGNTNNIDDSWNTIWQSNTEISTKDKYYEIAIPLDAINFDEGNSTWGVQFFINDTKINLFTTLEQSPRNFEEYDLRYTKEMKLENLPSKVSNKYSVIPSITYNNNKDVTTGITNDKLQVSLDGQYNITPSLRLDMTLNPDFSQVEVDQQVTNLSRFAINFPERRKFFLENSDLFSSLGTYEVDPFNSRSIGSNSEISFGTKLSGNLSSKTRLGIMHTQTKDDAEFNGQAYSIASVRHNFSQQVTSSTYLVNTQQGNHFNRVGGANLNYRSPDNKWIGIMDYGKAFTKGISGNNNFFNGQLFYNTPKLTWEIEYQKVQENYIAETGFIPQQFNYDAETDQTIREGFSILEAGFQIKHFPKESKHVDWIRRFWVSTETVFNQDNSLRSSSIFWSPFAIRFKNRSYVYVSSLISIDNLDYSFDFLQNGNLITPGKYTQTFGRIGYWTPTNKKLYMNVKLEYGQFYSGTRFNPEIRMSYRMLPTAVISASYFINAIDLNELGQRTFHLGRLTSEIYFSNRLNWTTYFQYNTQRDNFNVNSRIQWEYKPLSYVYVVFTNNYNNDFLSKNWGVSLKANMRLDF